MVSSLNIYRNGEINFCLKFNHRHHFNLGISSKIIIEYEILRDSYMRNNDGFILVYSMVDRSSFEELEKKFMNHIVQCKDGSMDVPMVLVGNKCDLESSRQVQKSVGRDMAKKWNIPFLELSAKQGTNVQECFQAIVRQLREMNEEEDGQPKKDTTDGQKKCLIM